MQRSITQLSLRLSRQQLTPGACGQTRLPSKVLDKHQSQWHSDATRTTTPSSSKPPASDGRKRHSDEGYLAFTKTSLYKLTLPLAGPKSSISHNLPATSSNVQGSGKEPNLSDKLDSNANRKDEDPWEQKVESGERPVARYRVESSAAEHQSQEQPRVRSVVFLLHTGQPLSYISSLIRAEEPDGFVEEGDQCDSPKAKRHPSNDPTGDPPITFHLENGDGKRWSSSTGIGDFMREAARVSSFAICIGNRSISVNVPSFEDRTRFLRASLHAKTREIEHLARVKDACDKEAKEVTQRKAIGGAGMLGVWWTTVGYLTFNTELGWDTMEPITYLTGLGTAIAGYIWFLWHNREVSYRTVLTETTSKRQHKLYAERGFNIERYQELIEDVKELRKDIKRVALDYDLTWDQGDTDAGKQSKRALHIVRKEEARQRRKGTQFDDEDENDEEDSEIDNDGDGKPDSQARVSR